MTKKYFGTDGIRGRVGAVSYTHLDVYKRQDKVVTRKPKASRDRSSEVYLLGLGKKPR